MPLRYIPNLDAVRAFGVLLVIAFHARYVAFGWIGIWLFFVLSGFLITRTLIPLSGLSLRAGLRIFYTRRVLRLWPAYYVYICAAALLLLVGGMAHSLLTPFLFAAFNVFNLSPLFDAPSGGRFFAHLWSLAIEEQYYVFIAPIVLLLGAARCIPLFIVVVLLSPAIRLLGFQFLQAGYGAPGAGELVQFLTPFQLDSFMLGGLLALREDLIKGLSGRSFALTSAVILGGAAVVLFANAENLIATGRLGPYGAVLDYAEMSEWRISATSFGIAAMPQENFLYVWLYSVIGLTSALLIAAVIRFLGGVRIPILNAIGKVSYGMYLYHFPLVSVFDRVMRRIAIPRQSLLGVCCLVVLCVVIWGVAAVSYALIERRFLHLKDRYFEPATLGRPPVEDAAAN